MATVVATIAVNLSNGLIDIFYYLLASPPAMQNFTPALWALCGSTQPDPIFYVNPQDDNRHNNALYGAICPFPSKPVYKSVDNDLRSW
jgi:hypothetical protein